MRIHDVITRIEDLEKNSGAGTAILFFANGSTRAITCDSLDLVCAAMTATHFAGRPIPEEFRAEQERFKDRITIFGRATRIEAPKGDNLWHLAFQLCQDLRKGETPNE
jgi:hypothetical protein